MKVTEARWVQKEKDELLISKQLQKWWKMAFRSAEEISINMQTKVSDYFSLIYIKCYRRFIAAPVDVLSPVLDLTASVDVLPRGSGNFGHDPSLGRFDVDWGNFQTVSGKSTSNNLATLYQH